MATAAESVLEIDERNTVDDDPLVVAAREAKQRAEQEEAEALAVVRRFRAVVTPGVLLRPAQEPTDDELMLARLDLPRAEERLARATIATRRATTAWREARERAQRRIVEDAQPEIRALTTRLYRLLLDDARPLAVALYEAQCSAARRAGGTPPTPDAPWLLPTGPHHESLLDTHAHHARAEGRLVAE